MGLGKILDEIFTHQIRTIIDEVKEIHPYTDGKDQYNDGWTDACDVLGHKILDLFKRKTDEDE